jgi:hypothetical protein
LFLTPSLPIVLVCALLLAAKLPESGILLNSPARCQCAEPLFTSATFASTCSPCTPSGTLSTSCLCWGPGDSRRMREVLYMQTHTSMRALEGTKQRLINTTEKRGFAEEMYSRAKRDLDVPGGNNTVERNWSDDVKGNMNSHACTQTYAHTSFQYGVILVTRGKHASRNQTWKMKRNETNTFELRSPEISGQKNYQHLYPYQHPCHPCQHHVPHRDLCQTLTRLEQ